MNRKKGTERKDEKRENKEREGEKENVMFTCKLSKLRWSVKRLLGMLPDKVLPAKFTETKFGCASKEIVLGMLPVRRLLERSIKVKSPKLEMELGIEPTKIEQTTNSLRTTTGFWCPAALANAASKGC